MTSRREEMSLHQMELIIDHHTEKIKFQSTKNLHAFDIIAANRDNFIKNTIITVSSQHFYNNTIFLTNNSS